MTPRDQLKQAMLQQLLSGEVYIAPNEQAAQRMAERLRLPYTTSQPRLWIPPPRREPPPEPGPPLTLMGLPVVVDGRRPTLIATPDIDTEALQRAWRQLQDMQAEARRREIQAREKIDWRREGF